MKKVLFVCIENSNRSQMAEAFAGKYGESLFESYSAGSRPSGKVNPRAIGFMKEKGYDLSSHNSKSLDEIPAGPFEYVITMGCGEECPFIPANHREDWDLQDPKTLSDEGFRSVRDDIERRVKELAKSFKMDSSES